MKILVANLGSTSFKYRLYDLDEGSETLLARGAVERIVASEEDAFDVVRAFLSYLPDSVFGTPPVTESADPADRREDVLLGAVPRNPRTP